MNNGRSSTCTAGFSLIEVCLAILVVGLGLLTVFSLFPSGLRSGEADTADTRAGLFTESVMNGLRANAMTITNRLEWENLNVNKIVQGVLTKGKAEANITPGIIDSVQFPDGTADWLRYRLTLNLATSARYSALLEVWDGQYGPTNLAQSTCYTEFWYSGI